MSWYGLMQNVLAYATMNWIYTSLVRDDIDPVSETSILAHSCLFVYIFLSLMYSPFILLFFLHVLSPFCYCCLFLCIIVITFSSISSSLPHPGLLFLLPSICLLLLPCQPHSFRPLSLPPIFDSTEFYQVSIHQSRLKFQ